MTNAPFRLHFFIWVVDVGSDVAVLFQWPAVGSGKRLFEKSERKDMICYR